MHISYERRIMVCVSNEKTAGPISSAHIKMDKES